MQTDNMAFLIAEANASKGPVAKAVKDSIEIGVVFPSALRKNLTDAGFTLKEDKAAMSEYGFASMAVLKRVLVTDKDDNLVAMGAAGDHDEALLHAMLGWFRENPSGENTVPEGVTTAPKS